jgi:hypothetical protein
VVVVLGAGVLGSFLPASAARASDTDLTSATLAARKAVGLPAIAENSAVLAAAGAVLDRGDAQGAFTSKGGVGKLVTAQVRAGQALSTGALKPVVFDPRLTGIAVLGRGTTLAVAAALDPARPFQAPVLAGAVADPGVPGSIAVLFPPKFGTIPQMSLERRQGSQLVTIGVAATAAPGVEGATLVSLKGRDRITGPQLGYGLTYTLRIGTDRSFPVQTTPIPSVLLSASFVPGPGFKGADRQLFLKTVDSLPPEGRKIVDTIRGAITASILANSAPICGAQTSCAGYDPGNGYFMIVNRAQLHSKLGEFAITHELGHLVDFLGLDTWAHEDFRKLFTTSPRWKSCFPLNGNCTPFLEVFADQFGFYSTNAVGVQSGYGDDRLATSPGFTGALQVQWAFRPPQERNPLAGYGPLAKSFELALHSSQDAL